MPDRAEAARLGNNKANNEATPSSTLRLGADRRLGAVRLAGCRTKRWSSEYQGAAKPIAGAGSSWRM
jgi:hypothetical protein